MKTRRSLLKLLPAVIAAPFIPTFGADELKSIRGVPVVWKDFFLGRAPTGRWDELMRITICTSQGDSYVYFYVKNQNIAPERVNSALFSSFSTNRGVKSYTIDSRLKNILKQSDFPA